MVVPDCELESNGENICDDIIFVKICYDIISL